MFEIAYSLLCSTGSVFGQMWACVMTKVKLVKLTLTGTWVPTESLKGLSKTTKEEFDSIQALEKKYWFLLKR